VAASHARGGDGGSGGEGAPTPWSSRARAQGVVFRNLSDATLYPVVCTYLSDRAGSLLRCQIVDSASAFPTTSRFASLALPGGTGTASVMGRGTEQIVRLSPPGDASSPASNITVDRDGTQMTSLNSTNSLAVATEGFGGSEKVAFVYQLTRDEAGNQGVCFGFCLTPRPGSFDYNSTSTGCWYR
jgi:hypothetical protein